MAADFGTAITAGLIGAVATAFLSFKVQNALAKRRRTEDEQRRAYVYLARVTSVVAMADLVVKLTKIWGEPLLKGTSTIAPPLKAPDGGYEPAHAICTALAAVLKDGNAVDPQMRPGVEMGLEGLKPLFDFRIPTGELAALPRDAIGAYSAFAEHASHTMGIIDMVKVGATSGNLTFLTAETLYSSFITLTKLADSARTLQSALMRFGAITPQDGFALYKGHFERYHDTLMAQIINAPKLAAAAEALKKVSAADASPPA